LAQLFLSVATDKSYASGRVIGHRLCGMTHIKHRGGFEGQGAV
jgi:hypothetical protein